MERTIEFEGEAVSLGRKEFIVPSLSVFDTRRLWPDFTRLNKGLTIEEFPNRLGVILDIIHSAISRNYPEMTMDEVGKLISVKNAGDVLTIVSKQSGFIESKSGEPKPVAVQ